MNPNGHEIAASYRVSAGQIPRDNWVHDLSQGGGRALGEVCHFVDSLRFVAGSAIESVYAVGYGAPDVPIRARDNVLTTLSFANGSVAAITYVADGRRGYRKSVSRSSPSRAPLYWTTTGSLELFGDGRLRSAVRGRRTRVMRGRSRPSWTELRVAGSTFRLPNWRTSVWLRSRSSSRFRTGRPIRVAEAQFSPR